MTLLTYYVIKRARLIVPCVFWLAVVILLKLCYHHYIIGNVDLAVSPKFCQLNLAFQRTDIEINFSDVSEQHMLKNRI